MPIIGHSMTTAVTTQTPTYQTINEIVTMNSYSEKIQDRIYGIILKQPGIRISDVCKICYGSRNNIEHHAHKLEYQRKIVFVKDGKYTRLFQIDTNQRKVPKFASRRQEQIFKALAVSSGLSQKEISRETGLSQQLVSYYLKKFLNDRIIESYPDKGSNKYRLKRSYK